MIDIRQGDCQELLATIPDGSIDLVLTDPPYGTVKGIASGPGVSHGMKGATEWDTALDNSVLLPELARVLRPNGACLLFGQEPFTGGLITNAPPSMPFSYRMTWLKNHFANGLGAKKAPVSYTEDINAFFKTCPKHDNASAHPLRPYFEELHAQTGVSRAQVLRDIGGRADHVMRYTSPQFLLCTEATYGGIVEQYALGAWAGLRGFEELRAVDSGYRASLVAEVVSMYPKVFNLELGSKHKSNVLEYAKDGGGHHPTQKPVALLRDLIRTYSREGDSVLDFTMGSGSTGVACVKEGRNFVGFELDAGYFNTAQERIMGAIYD